MSGGAGARWQEASAQGAREGVMGGAAWEGLVRVALLGTGRQALDPDTLPDAVRAALGERPSDEDPTALLLDAAALAAAYRRAGARPLSLTPQGIEPPPVDPRPLVPALAARRLGRLLSGEHAGLLPEWLDLAAALGRRVPPEWLPALAEAARTRTALRPAVAAAAGPRGRWLAAQAPQWAFLGDGEPAGDNADTWRYGSLVARWAWLERARRADPAVGREALARAWPGEPPNARAMFLDALRIGLGPDDEDFLEAALDDRAHEVRRLAAGLLARLPGSALGRRMADRLATLVRVTDAGIAITLPAECDPGMRRDGVAPVPPAGTGRRAWWFRQIVAATPLGWWGDPVAVLRRPMSDGTVDLPAAFAVAAIEQHDPAWAAVLLATGEPPAEHVAELIAVLPRDRWAAAVAAQAGRNRLPALVGVFLALPAPWPVDMGNLLLDRLAEQPAYRALAPIADAAARAVAPHCCRHPITDRPAPDDACPWYYRLVETLLFRRAMHEEMSP